MAAPDMPHPARAPHRPQNSAESHHDDEDELGELPILGGCSCCCCSTTGGEGEEAFFLSPNLRVVCVRAEGLLLFGTDARRTRRSG